MDLEAIEKRLLEIAEIRLRNRPHALARFQWEWTDPMGRLRSDQIGARSMLMRIWMNGQVNSISYALHGPDPTAYDAALIKYVDEWAAKYKEPELTALEPLPPVRALATAQTKTPVTRAVLIERHIERWPSIEQDMQNAARNGLKDAKAAQRNWNEERAIEWAKAKGRYTADETRVGASATSVFTLPSSRHRLR